MEHKWNVYLKIELMVNVTSTLDDPWLEIMITFLLGYPDNRGSDFPDFVLYRLVGAFIPKSMLLPFSMNRNKSAEN